MMNYNSLQLNITRAMKAQDNQLVRKLLKERKSRPVKQSVKVLVVGDDGVGKSSLICTLISNQANHFNEEIEMPDVYTDVSIPENEIGDNKVKVTIMDSSQNTSEEELKLKVLEADSIVVVYDIERRASLDHLMSYWLPLIVRHTKAPVILAGNKMDQMESRSDLMGSEEMQSLGERHIAAVAPLLEKYRNHIWACYECSAKTQRGVVEVFHLAQHVVVYPNAPLYDPTISDLTPRCKQAIARIFRYFDQDCDGLLNEEEINKFQLHCFDVSMDRDEISGLHKIIMTDTKNERNSVGVRPVDEERGGGKGVTLEGFLCIIRIFIKKDKFETPWMLLRLFGYDDNVELPAETRNQLSILPPLVPNESNLTSCYTLSKFAVSFLSRVFRQYSKVLKSSQVEYLDEDSLNLIFDVIPFSDDSWSCKAPWLMTGQEDCLKGSWEASGAWTCPCVSQWDVTLMEDSYHENTTPSAAAEEEDNENLFSTEASHQLFGMTFNRWINLWYFSAAINPLVTQRFINYLGYSDGTFEDRFKPCLVDRGYVNPITYSNLPQTFCDDNNETSLLDESVRVLRVLVTGSDQCGKSNFIQHELCSFTLGLDHLETIKPLNLPPNFPLTSLAHFNLQGVGHIEEETGSESKHENSFKICLVITEVASSLVPEITKNQSFDIALICFDSSQTSSLSTAWQLESFLPKQLPRLFVATKVDINNQSMKSLLVSNGELSNTNGTTDEPLACESQVYKDALNHCISEQIPAPLLTCSILKKLPNGLKMKEQHRTIIVSSATSTGDSIAVPHNTSILFKLTSKATSSSWFKVLCFGALASLTAVATGTLLKSYFAVDSMSEVVRKCRSSMVVIETR